jgi:hypothetical protein
MTMTFDSPLAFARHLERIRDNLPSTEKAALELGGRLLLDATRTAAEQEVGAPLADNIEMTADASTAQVGVPDREVQRPDGQRPVNIGDIAERTEFGTPGEPPRSFWAATAFTHGEAAASAIGGVVAAALAGTPLPAALRPPGAAAGSAARPSGQPAKNPSHDASDSSQPAIGESR